MKKMMYVLVATMTAAMLLSGCGAKDKTESGAVAESETVETEVTEEAKPANLEGTCEEILAKVYENAELSEDMRGAIANFQTMPLDETTVEYAIGTTEVKYTDSVYSMPMISAIAYQCVLLRVEEGQDVEEAKQLLVDHADPRKWVCVEPESILVENVGDVIFYIMADQATADAMKTAFLALGEE